MLYFVQCQHRMGFVCFSLLISSFKAPEQLFILSNGIGLTLACKITLFHQDYSTKVKDKPCVGQLLLHINVPLKIPVLYFFLYFTYSTIYAVGLAGKQHSSDFTRLISQVRGRLEATKQARVKQEVIVERENAKESCSSGI